MKNEQRERCTICGKFINGETYIDEEYEARMCFNCYDKHYGDESINSIDERYDV